MKPAQGILTEGKTVMTKFVVATFGTEAKAYEGKRALRDLHNEGEITLYGLAVVAKDAAGKLSIKDAPDDLAGTAFGTLVGALVGVLGGPAGVVVGMTKAPTFLTRCRLIWRPARRPS
jgi:uncharacterized membrane protein